MGRRSRWEYFRAPAIACCWGPSNPRTAYLKDFSEPLLAGTKAKNIIDKDNTTIVEGSGKSKKIEDRIRQLRTQVEETTSD